MRNDVPEQKGDGDVAQNVDRDNGIKEENEAQEYYANPQQMIIVRDPKSDMRRRINNVVEISDRAADNQAYELRGQICDPEVATPALGELILVGVGNRNGPVGLNSLERESENVLIRHGQDQEARKRNKRHEKYVPIMEKGQRM